MRKTLLYRLKTQKHNDTFNWLLLELLLVLLHCSHTAAMNQLPESLQVCYRFVHQLCVPGDGLQPGRKDWRGHVGRFQRLEAFTSLPFQRSAKFFVGFNEPVNDIGISGVPLVAAL